MVKQVNPPTAQGGPQWSKWIWPEGGCSLWRGTQTETGCIAEAAACEGPTLKQTSPEGLNSMERTHGRVLPLKNCRLWKAHV